MAPCLYDLFLYGFSDSKYQCTGLEHGEEAGRQHIIRSKQQQEAAGTGRAVGEDPGSPGEKTDGFCRSRLNAVT